MQKTSQHTCELKDRPCRMLTPPPPRTPWWGGAKPRQQAAAGKTCLACVALSGGGGRGGSSPHLAQSRLKKRVQSQGIVHTRTHNCLASVCWVTTTARRKRKRLYLLAFHSPFVAVLQRPLSPFLTPLPLGMQTEWSAAGDSRGVPFLP